MSAVVNLKDVLFGDGKTYRVIAFYQGEVVLFRMDKRGFQIDTIPFSDLESEIRTGNIVKITDPASDNRYAAHSDNEMNAAQKRYDLIAPIVTNPEAILESRLRTAIIRSQSISEEDFATKRRYAYRYLEKYFRDGMTVTCLTRSRDGSASRSYSVKTGRKSRTGLGTIVTDEIRNMMTSVITKNILKIGGLSVHQAYGVFTKEYRVANPSVPDNAIPTEAQFRYHYDTRISLADKVRKRNPSAIMDKDIAPATGTVLQVAQYPGARYEIDSTVDNVFLVASDRVLPVGRPVLYSVTDAFSGMIVGINISFEGSQYKSAAQALFNAIRNKQEFCRKYGIEIDNDEWPAEGIPSCVVADNGELEGRQIENFSKTFSVQISNTAPMRGDQKGTVESSFRQLQHQLKEFVAKAAPDPITLKKAGGKDNRHNAFLTLLDYTKLVIEAVRVVNRHVRTVIPVGYPVGRPVTPISVWQWAKKEGMWGLTTVDNPLRLRIALMPNVKPTVSSLGINVDGLRYECLADEVKTLFFRGAHNKARPKRVLVAYDPSDVSCAYLIPDSNRPMTVYRCQLTPKFARFAGMSIYEARRVLEEERTTTIMVQHENAIAEGETRRRQDQIVEEAITQKPTSELSVAEKIKRISESRMQERITQNREQSFASTESLKKPEPSRQIQNDDDELKPVQSFNDLSEGW